MSPESNAQELDPENSPIEPTGKTILIAEDDPFISRMYQTKLAMSGYAVVAVSDGRSALNYIQSHIPALIMLDLNMPELSGFEVIRALANSGFDMTRIKIVVLTNSGNPQDRKTAEALGASFIVKAEMTPQSVLDRIAELLKN